MKFRTAILAALIMFSAIEMPSCAKPTTAVTHPGQINATDGAMYDALTIVQASLLQVKALEALEPQYPQFKAQVNQAIASYDTALAAYKTYHSAGTGDAAALQASIQSLQGAVASLLTSFGVGAGGGK